MRFKNSKLAKLRYQGIYRILTSEDADRGAASVRTVLALGAFFYLFLHNYLQDSYSLARLDLVYVSFAYLVFSLLLLISTIAWPGGYLFRRIISMLADTIAVTYAMIFGGEVAAAFYGGYLWVTIANGLRYGRIYLYISNLFSVLGFSLVIGFAPFWHKHLTLGLGLMLWLILLPGYVSALLKRLEFALHKANFANKTKTDFLSNMSHELRTPLNVIISYSDLLEEDAVANGNRQLADDAGKIQHSANHLLALINGILELSRIESEKIHDNSERFDIRLLFENIQAGLQSRFDKRGNTFSIRYRLKHHKILSDQLKLKQVLHHVLDNANKFTTNGKIQVDVSSTGREMKPFLTIQVRDNGIGIPPGQLSTIFEPFTQLDSKITRKYEGVGLGLTIAKRFVDTLGGSIDVRSVEHEGSVVTIRIPQEGAILSTNTDMDKASDTLSQATG